MIPSFFFSSFYTRDELRQGDWTFPPLLLLSPSLLGISLVAVQRIAAGNYFVQEQWSSFCFVSSCRGRPLGTSWVPWPLARPISWLSRTAIVPTVNPDCSLSLCPRNNLVTGHGKLYFNQLLIIISNLSSLFSGAFAKTTKKGDYLRHISLFACNTSNPIGRIFMQIWYLSIFFFKYLQKT